MKIYRIPQHNKSWDGFLTSILSLKSCKSFPSNHFFPLPQFAQVETEVAGVLIKIQSGREKKN